MTGSQATKNRFGGETILECDASTGEHVFLGEWITDGGFAELAPRNVFHRQLEKISLSADPNLNSHILFRGKFTLEALPRVAKIYITADDYYKLYINGRFVTQGPAPGYHTSYNYNTVDLSEYLAEGENTVAVHTYYQGLINRVWQSGDFRHGLLFDFVCDGVTVLKSDESILTRRHSGYTEAGRSGYDTQIMERYDSRAEEVGFERPDFDDSGWETASVRRYCDYRLKAQDVPMLTFERIEPASVERRGNILFADFGSSYVGLPVIRAKGRSGQVVYLRMGAELNGDGSVRYELRCNCDYREEWVLSGGEDLLSQFDYKAFRYLEIEGDAEILELYLSARHYPATLRARLDPTLAADPEAVRIWELCTRSLIWGVQETIQDCTDREKGFYLGDGCYTAFAHMLITGDDRMTRKLIDDAFASSFITEGLVTCMSCSFMQEIAEYPLILPDLLLWHYRFTGDGDYLRSNITKMRRVLDFYRDSYEKDGLLCDLDRWCVVEWPKNFRDGYAVDVTEGQICTEAHISINAYYWHAVDTVNRLSELAGLPDYRDAEPLRQAIIDKFYDTGTHLFVDGEEHRHISLAGNAFPYAFGLLPDSEFEDGFMRLFRSKGPSSTSFFITFPLLFRFAKDGRFGEVYSYILDSGTWKRMLREGATVTFEGWGKDVKWNTSLFHLTMSAAAIFMTDGDIGRLLK